MTADTRGGMMAASRASKRADVTADRRAASTVAKKALTLAAYMNINK